MTPRSDDLQREEHLRSWRVRYGLALLTTTAALLVCLALLEVSDAPIYAPLVGAVAISAWLGGVGPAFLSLAAGWFGAIWLLVYPRGSLGASDTDDMTRWSVNLAVAALIVVIAGGMQLGRRRAVDVALEARRSLGRVEALQRLSADLARAATSADVSHALTEHAAGLLDAQGAALGLLEAEDILVVDPIGIAATLHVPGRRISLEQATLLTEALRTRRIVRADDRETIERMFPDSAAILPRVVQSAIAVPLRVAGTSVGVVEFLFDRSNAVDDELGALATTAAGLAEQALERARLYERERESAAVLDRILEVSPRFYADSPDEVTQAICREARTTFGADYGVLWRIRNVELELVRSDPIRQEWPVGLRVLLREFPGLERAVGTLGASFVPDVQAEARGEGLERVRQLGIRSSLRSPVIIDGRAELILVVSWQTVVDAPDPATVAILRRFADQAGLAFEQLERRLAEERAAARADETARLQEITAELSRAATRGVVGDTCVKHALRHVGAEAGFVVLTGSGGTSLQMISTHGYSDEALEAWSALGLDADVPFARAIATGEPVWALTTEEMGAFTAAPALGDAGWISIPLTTPAGIHGALHVSLHESRELGEAERRWLQSVVSQCALALERSQLYEEEQRLRLRSEQVQRVTARLSNALTEHDVADVVLEAAVEGVGGSEAVFYAVDDELHVVRRVAASPGAAQDGGERLERSFDEDSAVTRVARGGVWWLDAPQSSTAPERVDLVAPLVSGRRVVGVLELTWAEPVALGDDDRVFLETLANQGGQALDRARHFEAERSIAETLQRSVLPVALPRIEGVQIAARYLPGTREVDVGGDWFDAVQLPNGRLGLVVGDVVGKGVSAAASMGQLRNALRAFSIDGLKPASVLAKLDRLASDALDTTFATVVYAAVDMEEGILRFASAGHPPPVVARPDGRVDILDESRGLPVGTGLGPKYRQSAVELPAGSVVVLYSDGLVERRGSSIDEGLESLVAAVREAPLDSERLLEHVLERILSGAERADDVAILAARFLPVAPRPLDLRITPTESSLHLVRDAIRTWLEGTALERRDAEDLLLAAWEACANAVEHPTGRVDDLVRVRATVDDSHVRLVVSDSGTFVAATAREDRGLGLLLAERLASRAEILTDGPGTTVTLEKELPSATARLEKPDEQQDDDDER
ncbi:MAG TPA: SpoIIE family protein phosphatase [Gaiellaceae bacterium]|nr:SpoIIE family protein phosphatase [Gaiellaceae bacterium]